jgi:NAD-dependent DNA ligase
VLSVRVVARLATDEAARLAVNFLIAAPGLNIYAAALLLEAHYFHVGRVLRCTEEQLDAIAGIGSQRAHVLFAFWRRGHRVAPDF